MFLKGAWAYNARRPSERLAEDSRVRRQVPQSISDNDAADEASSSVRGDANLYKPNFCSECGERVVGTRSRLWTSRRFCRACAPRFRRGALKRSLLLASLLFLPGLLLGRWLRPTPPPLVIERGARTAAPLPPAPAKAQPAYGPDGTANERPTDPAEVVYICGARTKKGTPCQRRVRAPERCWQHRGKPAMLPPSKLAVAG